MAATGVALDTSVEQGRLLTHYLASTRQRFKAEVNRLTSGGMASLLRDQPDTADLVFPMSYLYIYHWLNHPLCQDSCHPTRIGF